MFCYLHTLEFLSLNSHVVSVMFEVPLTFDIGYELAHVEYGRLAHAPADAGCGLWKRWLRHCGCQLWALALAHVVTPF
ncbi:hypothetical protein FXO37_27434 [Capsicum annuum]|nr:hypothetical protein FXO37_27434 [Capsicum annuum]